MRNIILLFSVLWTAASVFAQTTVNQSRNYPFEDAKTRAQVSDYGAMNHLGTERTKAAARAMNAGADVEFPHLDKYLSLKQAIADGSVSEQRFEAAVKRALTLKMRMGLPDKIDLHDTSKPALDLDPPAHRRTSRKTLSE